MRAVGAKGDRGRGLLALHLTQLVARRNDPKRIAPLSSAEAKCEQSGLKATEHAFAPHFISSSFSPVATSHSVITPLESAEATCFPSGLKATEHAFSTHFISDSLSPVADAHSVITPLKSVAATIVPSGLKVIEVAGCAHLISRSLSPAAILQSVIAPLSSAEATTVPSGSGGEGDRGRGACALHLAHWTEQHVHPPFPMLEETDVSYC